MCPRDRGSRNKTRPGLAYLAGDNSLEAAAIDDFLEMAQVGSSDYLNIVVQKDRDAKSLRVVESR